MGTFGMNRQARRLDGYRIASTTSRTVITPATKATIASDCQDGLPGGVGSGVVIG